MDYQRRSFNDLFTAIIGRAPTQQETDDSLAEASDLLAALPPVTPPRAPEVQP